MNLIWLQWLSGAAAGIWLLATSLKISAVSTQLRDELITLDARALKMLALAWDASFASKSTFNQVFKKHTNQTPSDFRRPSAREFWFSVRR